jgi:pyruvate kinase
MTETSALRHTPVVKTKIVATLGPSTSDQETIIKMLNAGMTVARFNMSHGDHESHAKLMRTARAASKAAGRPLAILQDLSGPKIRIGDLETEEVTLRDGEKFTLTTEKCIGNEHRAWVNYKKLPKEVPVGTHIFLHDGKIQLKIIEVTDSEIHTEVVNGGTIRGRRGVNVPDAHLTLSTLTAKDKKDAAFGMQHGVDIFTLSFVREAKDIHQLRKLLAKRPNAMIAAKIETKAAIENLDEILEAADAVMVARGDLAIEVPPEKVPLLQKKIIRAANRAGKPVITATQMLDSMRVSTVPTRAEVNDIANAILDGTDAVMLSDETAVGAHPSRAVSVMSRVARQVESSEHFAALMPMWDFKPVTRCDAVSRSITKTAITMQAKTIVAFSESGYTGRMVARYRPLIPILVLTPSKEAFNQSLLTYGCEPVLVRRVMHLSEAQAVARKILKEKGLCEKGDVFVLGAGMPFGKPGSTNMMLVERM